MVIARWRSALCEVSCAALTVLTLAVLATGSAQAASRSLAQPIVVTEWRCPRPHGARRRLRVPRAALRRGPDRVLALARPAPAGRLARRPRRDAVRGELPADRERLRAAGPVQRGLPVPQRLHAHAPPRRPPARARVDPRRRPHPGRGPQLRRCEARRGRHGGRHHQLPARPARLPGAPRAGPAPRRPERQLRPDGPAGGAALGAAQHRARSAATRTT